VQRSELVELLDLYGEQLRKVGGSFNTMVPDTAYYAVTAEGLVLLLISDSEPVVWRLLVVQHRGCSPRSASTGRSLAGAESKPSTLVHLILSIAPMEVLAHSLSGHYPRRRFDRPRKLRAPSRHDKPCWSNCSADWSATCSLLWRLSFRHHGAGSPTPSGKFTASPAPSCAQQRSSTWRGNLLSTARCRLPVGVRFG
jgi:hypothetical protein